MSVQRRRGQTAFIWKSMAIIDNRGNEVRVAEDDGPYKVRAVFLPQRSARAEVPGQAQINVIRMLIDADVEDVDLWSRVQWNGRLWDVVTPPALHLGSRRVRHWSIDIRERP
ncbi:phage head-tail adapter protein [Actinoplanes sp. NPDC049265]|uniref:phage head-tail adapter protein n=1 Tax=Actinoplanes sp. NPDC049265 TaxID=3363902 RepID=UPI0037115679